MLSHPALASQAVSRVIRWSIRAEGEGIAMAAGTLKWFNGEKGFGFDTTRPARAPRAFRLPTSNGSDHDRHVFACSPRVRVPGGEVVGNTLWGVLRRLTSMAKNVVPRPVTIARFDESGR
jgi:hypothetical protein